MTTALTFRTFADPPAHGASVYVIRGGTLTITRAQIRLVWIKYDAVLPADFSRPYDPSQPHGPSGYQLRCKIVIDPTGELDGVPLDEPLKSSHYMVMAAESDLWCSATAFDAVRRGA